MITCFEYAALSAHIYNTEKLSIGAISVSSVDTISLEKGPPKAPHVSWYRVTGVDSNQSPHKPFFAQLYIKFEVDIATDAVMAIRGTKPLMLQNVTIDLLTWYADAIGIHSTSIPTVMLYLHHCINFYRLCRDYIARHFPHINIIKLTGHSLGGAVAQLMVLNADYSVPVVAFNSPGCGHLAGVQKEQAFWIHSLNSKYGIINKIGLTQGHLYAIDVPNLENEAKELCHDFNKALYNESRQYFQKASGSDFKNDIEAYRKGTWDALKLYASTYAKFESSEAIDAHYLRCINDEHKKHWDPKYAIEIGACIEVTATIEPEIVMYNQHSMENVINALYLDINLPIANKRM